MHGSGGPSPSRGQGLSNMAASSELQSRMPQAYVPQGMMRREAATFAYSQGEDSTQGVEPLPPVEGMHWLGPAPQRPAFGAEQYETMQRQEAHMLQPGQESAPLLEPEMLMESGSAMAPQSSQQPRGAPRRNEEGLMRRAPRSQQHPNMVDGDARPGTFVQYYVVVPVTMTTAAILFSAVLAAYLLIRIIRGENPIVAQGLKPSQDHRHRRRICGCSRHLRSRGKDGQDADSGDEPKTPCAEAADDSSDDCSLPRPDLVDDLDAMNEPEPEHEALVAMMEYSNSLETEANDVVSTAEDPPSEHAESEETVDQ